jgi:hypothetical protein
LTPVGKAASAPSAAEGVAISPSEVVECQQRRVLQIPFFFKQVAALHPADEMIPEDLRVRGYPPIAG